MLVTAEATATNPNREKKKKGYVERSWHLMIVKGEEKGDKRVA